MSYFDISFQKDLFQELLIGFDSLDQLYQVFSTTLWNLPGPHGRLLQDGEFYGDKIKDWYGVDKLPDIPGEIFYPEHYKYKDQKELIYVCKLSQSWPPHTRLIFASRMGALALFKYLVENGADIHSRNGQAVREAARLGHLEVIKYLVSQGTDIHAYDETALRWAAYGGYLEVVKYLVSQGANIHTKNNAALRWAAWEGHLNVVQYLVEHGADVNVLTPEQRKQYDV